MGIHLRYLSSKPCLRVSYIPQIPVKIRTKFVIVLQNSATYSTTWNTNIDMITNEWTDSLWKIHSPYIDVTYLIIFFTKVISRGRTSPKAIIPTTYSIMLWIHSTYFMRIDIVSDRSSLQLIWLSCYPF